MGKRIIKGKKRKGLRKRWWEDLDLGKKIKSKGKESIEVIGREKGDSVDERI